MLGDLVEKLVSLVIPLSALDSLGENEGGTSFLDDAVRVDVSYSLPGIFGISNERTEIFFLPPPPEAEPERKAVLASLLGYMKHLPGEVITADIHIRNRLVAAGYRVPVDGLSTLRRAYSSVLDKMFEDPCVLRRRESIAGLAQEAQPYFPVWNSSAHRFDFVYLEF